MRRSHWHILCDSRSLTMARRIPVRFDLSVSARMPAVGRLRLARQVRQDMWRLLKDLRGFSPVVRVEEQGGALLVTAGGAVDGAFPKARYEAALQEMLADPVRRARWTRYAGERRHV